MKFNFLLLIKKLNEEKKIGQRERGRERNEEEKEIIKEEFLFSWKKVFF